MGKPKDEPEPGSPVGVASQLLSLVGQATRDDLAQLDTIIVGKEKELDALKQTRRVLAIALGEVLPKGKRKTKPPPRGEDDPPAPRATPVAVDDRRLKAAKYILMHGPQGQAVLCRLFQIPTGSATHTFRHPWFCESKPGQLELSPMGREAARQAS